MDDSYEDLVSIVEGDFDVELRPTTRGGAVPPPIITGDEVCVLCALCVCLFVCLFVGLLVCWFVGWLVVCFVRRKETARVLARQSANGVVCLLCVASFCVVLFAL